MPAGGTLGAGYFTGVLRGSGLPALTSCLALAWQQQPPRGYGDAAWGGTGLCFPRGRFLGPGALVNHPSTCLQLWVVLELV